MAAGRGVPSPVRRPEHAPVGRKVNREGLHRAAVPTIRPGSADEREAIASVHAEAFGRREEASLTLALMDDPSAAPVVSLVALVENALVGHVLFTCADVGNARGAILCPLAVVPGAQRGGVGARLVKAGLEVLRREERAAFVFGDPAYYGRFGFRPASNFSVSAPQPLPAAHADAFMALCLAAPLPAGRLSVADTLDEPALWSV